MRRTWLLVLAWAAFAAADAPAQEPGPQDTLEARVWLDRGEEPVVQTGDAVRIYYRTSHDAYAAIFHIDTDGRIRLLFPQDPTVDARVRGGRDYRLLFPRSPIWRVTDDPGVGYFFMVASPEPLDFSGLAFEPGLGWDLSVVGDLVYEDPYIAIDDYVAYLIPDWETVPYALDFITYDVGETHTYPRFLCYDCHDARPYAAWNPYAYTCSTYRVVIYDDPYFYPAYRYVGTRVVVAPFRARPRYAIAVRAAGDPVRPLIVRRDAPPRRVAEFKEPADAGAGRGGAERRAATRPSAAQASPAVRETPSARATPRAGVTPRATAPGSEPSARLGGSTVREAEPGGRGVQDRPTLQRRPSSRLPIRRPPAASGLRDDSGRALQDARRGSSRIPERPDARERIERYDRRPSTDELRVPGTRGSAPRVPVRPQARGGAERPDVRGVPSRPDVRGVPSRGGVRPPMRPSGRPSAGSRGAGPPAASAAPSSGRPTLRPSTARPTVRPRRPPPRRRRPGG